MLFLLAIAAIAGDSALVGTLRGIAVESEQHQALSLGYYESLINIQGNKIDAGEPHPPPGWLPFGGEVTGIVREVPNYLRWEMKPNLDIRWNGTAFRTNSAGFRTPDVSREKPEGTYRILVFGSSNTMGYGVDTGQEYVRHLERWLNERPRAAGRIEVVNLAVAGESPTRRLERMRQEAGRWNPDWILCDATVFDTWLEENHLHSVLQQGIPIPYQFVKDAIQRAGVTGAESIDVFRDKFRIESERLLDLVYAAWSEEAARLHVPFSVVMLPRADSKEKSPRVSELIRTFALRNGIDFLDLSDSFDDMEVEEFRISEWDKHPSARGHQAIFESLRDAIVRRGELPGMASLSRLPTRGQSLAADAGRTGQFGVSQ